MNLNTAKDLERCLMHVLCRKLSLRENQTTAPVDKLAALLLDFSQFFQDEFLKTLYKFPAELMESEELFVAFLNSVCTKICQQGETKEKKLYVLCAFTTIVVTLSIMTRCHRLIRNMKSVLPAYLNNKYFSDLDVDFAFQYLEGSMRQYTAERQWMPAQLNKVVEYIQKAGENISSTLERRPTIATRIKAVFYARDPSSANAAAASASETCPHCKENCKPYIQPFLTLEGSTAE